MHDKQDPEQDIALHPGFIFPVLFKSKAEIRAPAMAFALIESDVHIKIIIDQREQIFVHVFELRYIPDDPAAREQLHQIERNVFLIKQTDDFRVYMNKSKAWDFLHGSCL